VGERGGKPFCAPEIARKVKKGNPFSEESARSKRKKNIEDLNGNDLEKDRPTKS